MGAAQILICSTPVCSCLQCPQLSELVRFPLWALSMAFYIFHRHRVCLVDRVDLICSLYSSWKCLVFFLNHTAPGFQLWFYLHPYKWVVHWGLALEAALEGLGLPLWGPGMEVVQLLGSWVRAAPVLRGLTAREAGNIVLSKGMATSIGQYTPVFLPGEPPP